MSNVISDSGNCEPLPNRDLFVTVLKKVAASVYLENCPNRTSRRAMPHNLRGVYEFIGKETALSRWREEYDDYPPAQERCAMVVAAMARDIATGTPMLSPNSAFQAVMSEYSPERVEGGNG